MARTSPQPNRRPAIGGNFDLLKRSLATDGNPIRFRQGKVIAYSSVANTVDVQIAGATDESGTPVVTAGIKLFGNFIPDINQAVWLVTDNTDIFAIGQLAPYGLAGGGGGGGTGNVAYQPDAPASPSIGDVWIESDVDIFDVATYTMTFTNKTLNLTSNTLTGTKAQFNTAMSDADFATIAGTETLTNKTLTDPIVSSLNGGQLAGFRNIIINGNFQINQRNYTSGANLASGSYGFDRWKSNFTNTTLTFTSAPQGQMLTINSGGGIEQVIERGNVPAGTYTLSWTGTATGRVYNTGATPPSYATSPITVTLDGTANVEVEFTASGGTRTLQNAQLEKSSTATPFEHRFIGIETTLCHRYFQRFPDPAGFGVNNNGNATRVLMPLYTRMRAIPTTVLSGTFNFWNGSGVGTSTSLSTAYNSISHGQLDFIGGAGTSTQPNALYTTGGSQYIDFISEL
jgi:hypothetical protein